MKKEKDCSRKKGKLKQLTILCMTAMLMFSACGNRPTPKERVLAVFEEQKELISEKIADYIAGDEVEWDDLEGVLWVSPYINGTIEFECISEGLMTASFQAGFYYSPDDAPAYVGWFLGNKLSELVEDGDGYSYSDGTDNRYYTERICEHFYYYTKAN